MSHNWKDAYEAQMELWRWCRSDFGLRWRQEHFSVNTDGLDFNPDAVDLLGRIYQAEEDKLLTADPYYVSPEMCRLISAASETFRPEPIIATDFLSDTGFVFFAEPFGIIDRYGTPINLAGFSWCQMHTVDTDGVRARGEKLDEFDGSGVALSLYVKTKRDLPSWRPEWPAPPSLISSHHTPWWFNMTFDGNELDVNGVATAVDQWWKILQTTLRLMQQRLSRRYSLRPDRATRHRATRLGFEEREVVVVRLRREGNDPHQDHDHEPANYSHRFIVSGHWRNQWYPSGNVHRQIWISPYVKGPEDQPLVVRPKRVFTFNR